MCALREEVKVDYFPTVEEIVNSVPITRCEDCGRMFQNSSACRFHRLKQHLQMDKSNTNDKRLFDRSLKEPRIVMSFHCPDPMCRSKKVCWDGIRNLKQHYFRAHTEKKWSCDKCGFKSALEKDMKYHRKVRCPKLESKLKKKTSSELKSTTKNRKGRGVKPHKTKTDETASRRQRRSADATDDEDNDSSRSGTPQPRSSTASAPTVVQPIYFIVNPENVHSVIGSLQKALNPIDLSLNSLGRQLPSRAQMEFVQREQIPILNNGVQSTSFATQYDPEPATYCERGTMMTEEPLNYFDPPYGEEFGDMTPRQKTGDFPYSMPSTSQPQTRSFGTMFENVTTCNTGTSMIEESFVSEFLRDIETQTPSYMIQRPPRIDQAPSASSDDWTWRMTDSDI